MKKCNPQSSLNKDCFIQAVKILKNGGVIAFPTETYYGLAVDPFNQEALRKLFLIKGRPENKPVLLLIEKIEQLFLVTEEIPEQYTKLIETYWPGPLTLIFKAREILDPLLTGGTGTIGVRISSHPIANSFFRKWHNPITATSANISGKPPAKSSAEVADYFGESIDYILEGGETAAGLCSTIVAHSGNALQLVRKGQVDFDLLLKYYNNTLKS